MSAMPTMLLARIADPSADVLAELAARLAPALASPDHAVCSLPSLWGTKPHACSANANAIPHDDTCGSATPMKTRRRNTR